MTVSISSLTLEARPLPGLLLRAENNYNTTYNFNHWDVLAIYSMIRMALLA